MMTVDDRFNIRIDSEGNPLLEGGYAPIECEVTAQYLEVIGEVPTDIAGAYVRNGPNPRYQPRGRYHIFDGDGMVHSALFEDGKVTYRNRWIRTRGYEMESEAGGSIWPGLMEPPDRSLPVAWGSHHWLKDASNTDITPFNGRLLTTFYQCGVPYILDATTLDTVGPLPTEDLKIRQVSAHARTDLATGELMFFDYDVTPPYMTYGVLGADGSVKHFIDIDLPGARLPHDMAVTSNYTILMDLSLFWDPKLLERDVHKATFFPDQPSRFAVLPRYGSADDIRWFEVEPCYIYHVINSWEDGDEIILDVCRMRTPEPAPERMSGGRYSSLIAWASMDAQYYRYRLNLKTGAAKEEALDDQFIEFPTINQFYQGKKSRRAYAAYIPQGEPLRMAGIVAYGPDGSSRQEHHYDRGVYASEPIFAPRVNATDEDDGYVMTFVTDMNQGDGQSELHIFDPDALARGPIARVKIPQRMPMGFHACWAPTALMR